LYSWRQQSKLAGAIAFETAVKIWFPLGTDFEANKALRIRAGHADLFATRASPGKGHKASFLKSGNDRGKALVILGGRHFDMTHESTSQSIRVSKSAMPGHLFARFVPKLEQASGGVDASSFDPCRRCDSHFAAKQPCEMARVELNALG
jgi:hypothetical protein